MDGHSENTALFITLTGADAATAEQYLEMCDWNVEEVRAAWNYGDLYILTQPTCEIAGLALVL